MIDLDKVYFRMMDSTTNDDATDAYRAIINAIVTQKLAPSQKVSENIISEMFGFSRAISRNLIERLIAKQFLVSISPRVTQVAPLTLLEIKQNFMLRKMLLPEIISIAAARIDFDAVHALNAEIQAIFPIENDEAALKVLKSNKRVNMLLCENAGYPLMLDWVNQLEDTAMRIYWLYVKANKSFPYSTQQHAASIDVIKSEEPARISTVIHDMISQTEERILNTVFSHPQFYTQDLKV